MNPDAFYAIMQEAGVSPEQVIIVSAKGDFINYGFSYHDAAPTRWTSIYIESGPGVSTVDWVSSHSVPIDGWINGDTYTVRVNGGTPIETTLGDIYRQTVN